ncbi:CPBP family intramembrane glutamic endopeptidase [Halobacteriaceae archaeon GCM10025711]
MVVAPEWSLFAGIAALVTLTLVTLARASQGVVTEQPAPAPAQERMSPELLLANVALSQGLLAVVLALGAWYAAIPLAALGLGPDALGAGAVLVGVAVGVALYAANEGMALVAKRVGVGYAEDLRELLAPASAREWTVLLVAVLPIIAGFEEFLFRSVLVGAVAAGFGVSPWLLAVGSSVLFGFAHGAQGLGGMLVTGTLGFILAAAFIATDSLLVVVVAHYLVNALEFVVHEGLGVEWG